MFGNLFLIIVLLFLGKFLFFLGFGILKIVLSLLTVGLFFIIIPISFALILPVLIFGCGIFIVMFFIKLLT